MTEWRPIEEAPLDGTYVLMGYSVPEAVPVVVRWGTYHPNAPGKESWRTTHRHKMSEGDRFALLPLHGGSV